MGARGRRRLLEGPDQRPRPDRRPRDAELLARALSAAATGAATETEALTDYHLTRDRLSMPLFTVVDTIAGLRWTDAEIPGLLYRLSEAMNDELHAMDRLDQQPALTLGGPP